MPGVWARILQDGISCNGFWLSRPRVFPESYSEMEITWVADTPQTRSRARAPRACNSCQRKKKRCSHFWNHLETDPGQNPRQLNLPDGQHDGAQVPAESMLHQSAIPSPSTAARTERFVGDLNPEAVIRERLDSSSAKPFRDRIGLWISSPETQGDGDSNDKAHHAQLSSAVEPSAGGQLPQQPIETIASFMRQQYAAALNSCERLPLTTRDRLLPIYFSRVNHILPLLDKDSFLSAHSDGTASVFLERAICLVAAKDPEAVSSLRLTVDGPVLNSRQFCSEVYKGLVVAVNAGLEPDRMASIRTLALMSLHCEGFEGAEAASMHLCQAVHLAQTAGLHLNRPGRAPGDAVSRLFWCLWTLDKMHASIGGRPVILADCDIGIEKPDINTPTSRSAFDVWLSISDLLATVISFYRPGADYNVGWDDSFPTFEQIVGVNIRDDLDFMTLGILEMYYHAVGILSCRPKLSDRSDGLEPSYVRQGLAAVRICSIVSSECSQGLPPLPIVPYALSLSMGVSYQQFRSSKLITHFDRAKNSLGACCTLLEGLGVYWYSAEAMARLGRKALHHIEGLKSDRQVAPDGTPTTAVNYSVPVSDHSATLSSYPYITGYGYNNASNGSELVREDPTMAPTQDTTSTLESMEPYTTTDSVGNDSFADIDMLFGDFLDLSLPTNFWDPVFFTTEENNNDNHDGAV